MNNTSIFLLLLLLFYAMFVLPSNTLECAESDKTCTATTISVLLFTKIEISAISLAGIPKNYANIV
jgi:hypothetical protein